VQQIVLWILIVVMAIYIRQIATGDSVPNPATWLVMSVVGVINAITYGVTIHWDLWPTLVGAVPAVGIIITFLFSYLRGKFSPLGTREKWVIGIAMASVVVWRTVGADVGNIVVQIIFLVAFWPTAAQIIRGRKEKSLPWDLALVAYTLMAVSLFLDKRPSLFSREIAMMAYPFSRILMNGTIAVLCRLKKVV